MSEQTKPLTKAQKQEKAKHLLVLLENAKNAEADFDLACSQIAREFEMPKSLLKKAVKLEYARKLGAEVATLESKADALDELHTIFINMYTEKENG